MATRTARAKGRAARDEESAQSIERSAERRRTTKRFYEYLLLYPTLGLALITAAPTWVDKYQAYRQNIRSQDVADAKRQAQLWQKNLSCAGAPFAWYSSPRDIKVDATLCNSGDILVSAVTPDARQHFKWVPLDEVVPQSDRAGGLIPAANAATLGPLPARDPAPLLARDPAAPLSRAPLRLAQETATVLCQKLVEGRYILRRIRTPQGCFDEKIDTYNGTTVARVAAPCVPQC